jgi:broad specificity phosphatase PhoE
MIVAFLRHGATGWNAAGRMQGRADPPLSADGRTALQGKRLPAGLAGARWVSSPARRARETARLLGADAVEVANDLVEMDWGAWEGETLASLRLDADFVANEARGLDFQPPGGESPRAVMRRVAAWLAAPVDETPIVAVTHKGVIRAVLCLATGWDMLGKPPAKLDWNCLQLFEARAGAVRVAQLNLPLAA